MELNKFKGGFLPNSDPDFIVKNINNENKLINNNIIKLFITESSTTLDIQSKKNYQKFIFIILVKNKQIAFFI